MRISYTVFAGGLLTLGLYTSAMAVQNTAPAGYQWQTIWSDEFNYTGVPDASKWSYYQGGIGNGEVQGYIHSDRTQNAYVENGSLRITAIKESYVQGSKTYSYSSARIDTKNKFTVQYGRIEASIKMPAGIGSWPAFWTLGANAGWPSGGEIDIVEYGAGKGYPQPANFIDRNFLYRNTSGQTEANRNFTLLHDVTPTDGYHTYAVEWDRDWMRWYYDDNNYATTRVTPELLDAYAGTTPSSQPHYVILNVAMGGTGGGGIDPNFTSTSMLVDYVRVSKLTAVPEPASAGLLLAMGAGAMLRRRRAMTGR